MDVNGTCCCEPGLNFGTRPAQCSHSGSLARGNPACEGATPFADNEVPPSRPSEACAAATHFTFRSVFDLQEPAVLTIPSLCGGPGQALSPVIKCHSFSRGRDYLVGQRAGRRLTALKARTAARTSRTIDAESTPGQATYPVQRAWKQRHCPGRRLDVASLRYVGGQDNQEAHLPVRLAVCACSLVGMYWQVILADFREVSSVTADRHCAWPSPLPIEQPSKEQASLPFANKPQKASI